MSTRASAARALGGCLAVLAAGCAFEDLSDFHSGSGANDAGAGAEGGRPDPGGVVDAGVAPFDASRGGDAGAPSPDAGDPPAPDGACVGSGTVEDPVTKRCYAFFAVGGTWTEAETACARWGGHLASLTSEAEWQLVASGLSGTVGVSDLWIGGSDLSKEGTFTWSTGEPWSFSVWQAGEPNNDGQEDCIEMVPSEGWRWNDNQCADVEPYLCEK